MNRFIVMAPLITFINCQTKKEIKMNCTISYNKFGDEIILDYAMICDEEYKEILYWLLNENFVKINLCFSTYVGDNEEVIGPRKRDYEESYPVVMVYKPYVKSASCEEAGIIEFKIKVRE